MLDYIILFVIAFVVYCTGLIVGTCSTNKKLNSKPGGSIIINTMDAAKDVIRIELDMPVGEMIQKKNLVFKVVNEDLNERS